MSLTIEGYHPNGYDLTDAAWNPVTNTGTIAFGTSPKAAALQGETVAAWNVTNQGTISGGDGGIGVDLLAGGSVSNLASGYIDGYFSVMIQGSAGTVSNDGTIVSTDAAGAGVYLTHGGSVSNWADGRISTNYDGITTDNGIGLVENAGTITAGNAGVDLVEGGSATNDAGGMISGTWGIAIQNYMLGSVLNLGTIVGGAESGVYLAGGSVTNEVGGQISGTWGVAITGGLGIVVNAGTIASTAAGENATAVTLKSGFANEVVVDPGAVFIGMVDGGNAVGGDTVSTLELASGLAAGTLSGFGTQFVDFGAIVFDPNAAWLLSGTAAGLSGPEITGFAAGDTIELTGVSATLQGYDLGVLTLATQGGTIDLDVAGNFIAASFQVSDVGGNTDIVLAPVPSVSAATASPNAGQVRTSGEVILTLAMSQAVTVSGGTPTLTLNDGGIATYLSGSGSAALVFGYTVAAGERSADIAITSSSLNGATIENAAGLAADLSGAGAITGGTPQIIGATQVCDLTGNGTSDILFRDAGTGALGDFVMNNSQPTWNAIGWAGTNWEVAGVGDFEGKGTDDILFRDPTSGGMGDFIMTNGQPAWSAIGWAAPGLQVAGVGDFTGNGIDDILLRDPITGGIGDFLMNNGQPTWASIGWADPSMQVAGVGDFNGDGTSDILFRDPGTGGLSMFAMQDNQPTWSPVGWASTDWQVAGVGDFNGDGTSDILFRNASTGALGDFLMSNGQPTWAPVGWTSTSLQVAAIGDYNGDGTSDILFREATSGALGEFAMHDNQPTWTPIGATAPNWQVVA